MDMKPWGARTKRLDSVRSGRSGCVQYAAGRANVLGREAPSRKDDSCALQEYQSPHWVHTTSAVDGFSSRLQKLSVSRLRQSQLLETETSLCSPVFAAAF